MALGEYEILDDRFPFCVSTSARVERLHQGSIWAEGPVYFPAHRSLVWSDIPNERLLRWDEITGQVSVFSHRSDFTNGNTVDRQGRLVSCQQGTRRVVRREHDGSLTVLADRFEGQRLNSPNDVVVRSDDSIWFTDPRYGIDSYFEGYRAESDIGADNVYRLDPQSGECRIVCDDFRRPNGLAFSPDESKLYIVESGGIRYPENPRHLRVFDVQPDGALSGGEIFAQCTVGKFDGLRVDESGRLWISAGDGVHCYEPDGTLIGKILLPEPVSNLVFGGPRRNRLYITATSSLYTVLLAVRGAAVF
ncbi:MAG: SMP-30/gluconolactonase/LRE family protein [Acidobacteriota bacterium]